MKAFLVGFLFLCVVLLLTGVGFLLLPLLLILTFFLRIAVGFALVLFAIWLLGQFVLFLWKAMDKKAGDGTRQV
jgi:hypothetical protein